jgi:hypothetical protein
MLKSILLTPNDCVKNCIQQLSSTFSVLVAIETNKAFIQTELVSTRYLVIRWGVCYHTKQRF